MKPQLYLLNGPLGAGKTTLLKTLLQQAEFASARVIENEFASTSIDTDLLHDHQSEVRTIAGTCICCGSGEELVEALQALKTSNAPVIIEATGVANSLLLLEKMIAADIFASYTLAHSIFVLDAAEYSADSLASYADELRAADTVLLSKTDLIDDTSRVALERALTQRGVSKFHHVRHGVCDLTPLQQPSRMLEYYANYERKIIRHASKITYTITELGGLRLDPQKIRRAWPGLQQRFALQRLKGNGMAPDGNWWHINATPSQCRITRGRSGIAQLVWIGDRAHEISLDVLEEACS